LTPVLLTGAALGLATGFLLGELFGSPKELARAIRPRKAAGRRTPFELTTELQAALARALGPDAQTLELAPVSKTTIELHGWVTSRRTRAKALRTAREVLGSDIRLVDCLLVWGEDDAPTGEFPIAGERETA